MVNGYEQDMKVKNLGIESGKLVVILNESDAKELGINPLERVEIKNKKNGRTCVAVVDLTKKIVNIGEIGLFDGVKKDLVIQTKEIVSVKAAEPIKSLEYIKKKMDNKKLSFEEIFQIVKDLDENRLSEIEGSAFISSVYINGLDLEETTHMTQALIENGNRLKINKTPIVDKHSIGGVNGRATMIIVPIVASMGLYVPKTSSRSITSAGGTADAMEVLAPVSFTLEKIKSITEKNGACIVWGGAVDLAPADDKIIKLEHPLSLDPQGQVIASVLAKKASVGSQYVVIDIPVGKNVKVHDKKRAMEMAEMFVEVGKRVGMEVEALITNGEEPSGLAFGPALEAKYALEILEGKRFDNLAQKSCELAGALFELVGIAKINQGYKMARDILESKRAYEKMKEIIKAQGGKINSSQQIIISPLNTEIKSNEIGTLSEINLKELTKISRIAGAPKDKLAGVMLNKIIGEKVCENELLFTIYAENQRKLDAAKKYAENTKIFAFERIILDRIR
jgi:AMP phosphorylase